MRNINIDEETFTEISNDPQRKGSSKAIKQKWPTFDSLEIFNRDSAAAQAVTLRVHSSRPSQVSETLQQLMLSYSLSVSHVKIHFFALDSKNAHIFSQAFLVQFFI